MNFSSLPALDRYLSLQEMQAVFKSATQEKGFSQQVVGYSKQDRPIELLKYVHPSVAQDTIQNKSLRPRILLYGGEDATEPIFSQTIKWVIQELKNQQSTIHALNCDWYFIDCINPDGYLLNEEWYCQPGDLTAFFEHAWEDEHTQMIFMNAERPEVKALHHAFEICTPDFVFNMHDESHFPADGYKLAFSAPVDTHLLNDHFKRVSADMDISKDERIIMDSYGQEACFSTHMALKQNPEAFIFINESCGYKRVQNTDEFEVLEPGHPVYTHLQRYQSILNHDDSQWRFHVKALLRSVENAEAFNAKMLSLTGYGLTHLIKKGVEEAKPMKEAFLSYILNKYQNSYVPIEVSKQVLAQLDALFTLLQWKLGDRKETSLDELPAPTAATATQ